MAATMTECGAQIDVTARAHSPGPPAPSTPANSKTTVATVKERSSTQMAPGTRATGEMIRKRERVRKRDIDTCYSFCAM